MILTSNDAGPPEVVEQLKASGIVIEFVNFENSVESTPEAVKKAGRIPDVEDKAGVFASSGFPP